MLFVSFNYILLSLTNPEVICNICGLCNEKYRILYLLVFLQAIFIILLLDTIEAAKNFFLFMTDSLRIFGEFTHSGTRLFITIILIFSIEKYIFLYSNLMSVVHTLGTLMILWLLLDSEKTTKLTRESYTL